MMCDKCWANNSGGVWCWRHPAEVTEEDCRKCEESKEREEDRERRDDMTEEDKKLKERREGHIKALQEMREMMLEDDNWENMKRLIEAVTAGGIALQRLNVIDFREK